MAEIDEESMLTTYDNPYDPFTHFDEWLAYDLRNGTDCCGILNRMYDVVCDEEKINKNSESFLDEETERILLDKATNKILKLNPLIYLTVHPNDKRYTLSEEEFKKTIPQIVEE